MKKLFSILVSLTICLSLVFGMASCKKKNKGNNEDTSTVQESESSNSQNESQTNTGSESTFESTSESENESGNESGEEEVTFTFEDIPGFVSASAGGADTTVGELIDSYKQSMTTGNSYEIHLTVDVTDIGTIFNERIESAIVEISINGDFETPYCCDVFTQATMEMKEDPDDSGSAEVAPSDEEETFKVAHGIELLIRELGVYSAEYEINYEGEEEEKVYEDEPIYSAHYFRYMYIDELSLADLISMAMDKFDEIKEEYDLTSYVDMLFGYLDTDMFNGILTEAQDEEGAYYLNVEFNFAETVNSILTVLTSLRDVKLDDLFGQFVDQIEEYLAEDPTLVSMLDAVVAAMEIEDVDTFEGLMAMLEEKYPYAQMLEEVSALGILDEEIMEVLGGFETYYDIVAPFLSYPEEQDPSSDNPPAVHYVTIHEFLGNFDIDLDGILAMVDQFMDLTVEEAINALASMGDHDDEILVEEGTPNSQDDEPVEPAPGVGTMIFDTLEAVEFEELGFYFKAEILPGEYAGMYMSANVDMNYTMPAEADPSSDSETAPSPVVINFSKGIYLSCYAYVNEGAYEYVVPSEVDYMNFEYLYLATDNHEVLVDSDLESINNYLGAELSSYEDAEARIIEQFENNTAKYLKVGVSYEFYATYDGEGFNFVIKTYDHYDSESGESIYLTVDYECDDNGYLTVLDGWALEYDVENACYNCSKTVTFATGIEITYCCTASAEYPIKL